jgi:carboxyl-terminal processing protease
MAPRILIILCLMLTLVVVSPARADDPASSAPLDAATQSPNLTVFDEVWQLVQERFYDPTLRGVDWSAVRHKYRPLALAATSAEERSMVINRMLDELAASHTRHYTASDPAYYQLLDIFSRALRHGLQRLFPEGQVAYPGIGIFTRQLGGKTFVSGILAGLPAAHAGLLVGDELLTVNDAPYQPVHSFAARVGQEVRLRIRRTPDGPPQDIVVVPRQLQPNAAFLQAMQESARLIDANGVKIGYIHIWSYAGGQYQRLLEEVLSTGALKAADALIVDLRDGWGGAQAHYLDLFSGASPTVTMVERDGDTAIANVKWRKPVVLLVNHGTRSGKEILTYGFKKYGLGAVVGTPTAGAVLAGRAFLLSDDSLLLLAVNDVFVDGQRLEGSGVTPTVDVPFALEYAQGKDPQLDRAVELLSRQVRG